MFEEEPKDVAPIDLERFSVEELEARISELKQQIVACEDELERKRNHKSAADALFGGSS